MTKNGRFPWSAIILFAVVILNVNAAAAAMSTDDFFALCKTGTAREIETAISDGADVNAKDKNGKTALMLANSLKIIVMLEEAARTQEKKP
jgi:hypothetical protein